MYILKPIQIFKWPEPRSDRCVYFESPLTSPRPGVTVYDLKSCSGPPLVYRSNFFMLSPLRGGHGGLSDTDMWTDKIARHNTTHWLDLCWPLRHSPGTIPFWQFPSSFFFNTHVVIVNYASLNFDRYLLEDLDFTFRLQSYYFSFNVLANLVIHLLDPYALPTSNNFLP
jgi:hypothetical protein